MTIKIGFFSAKTNFEDRISNLLNRDYEVIDLTTSTDKKTYIKYLNNNYNSISDIIHENSIKVILITSELIEKLDDKFFTLLYELDKASLSKKIKLIFIDQKISYNKNGCLVKFSSKKFTSKLKKIIDNFKTISRDNIIVFSADIILAVSDIREKNIFDTVYPVKKIELCPGSLEKKKLNVLNADEIYKNIYFWLQFDKKDFDPKYLNISFQDFNRIVKSGFSHQTTKKFAVFNDYISQHNCAFEVIYRMKPIEIFPKYSIANLRYELGTKLFTKKSKEFWNSKIDFIVPVPETGKYYAQGLAKMSKKPYLEAIYRNPEVKRSFDLSDQTRRKAVLYEKLKIIKDLVKYKSICLVDEAIFTGATLKTICNQLRGIGVKSIYIAIPTPRCYRQCHINMQPPRNLLLEYQRSENLPAYFDCDDVFFGHEEEFDAELSKHGRFCYSCFQK